MGESRQNPFDLGFPRDMRVRSRPMYNSIRPDDHDNEEDDDDDDGYLVMRKRATVCAHLSSLHCGKRQLTRPMTATAAISCGSPFIYPMKVYGGVCRRRPRVPYVVAGFAADAEGEARGQAWHKQTEQSG